MDYPDVMVGKHADAKNGRKLNKVVTKKSNADNNTHMKVENQWQTAPQC